MKPEVEDCHFSIRIHILDVECLGSHNPLWIQPLSPLSFMGYVELLGIDSGQYPKVQAERHAPYPLCRTS